MISNRLETGKTCCDGDWPGLFIRGDNCFGFALTIDTAIDYIRSSVEWGDKTNCTAEMEIVLLQLQDLQRLLESTNIQKECQTINSLKSFEECKR